MPTYKDLDVWYHKMEDCYPWFPNVDGAKELDKLVHPNRDSTNTVSDNVMEAMGRLEREILLNGKNYNTPPGLKC